MCHEFVHNFNELEEYLAVFGVETWANHLETLFYLLFDVLVRTFVLTFFHERKLDNFEIAARFPGTLENTFLIVVGVHLVVFENNFNDLVRLRHKSHVLFSL